MGASVTLKPGVVSVRAVVLPRKRPGMTTNEHSKASGAACGAVSTRPQAQEIK